MGADAARLRRDRRTSCTPGADGAPTSSFVSDGCAFSGAMRSDCWSVWIGCLSQGTYHYDVDASLVRSNMSEQKKDSFVRCSMFNRLTERLSSDPATPSGCLRAHAEVATTVIHIAKPALSGGCVAAGRKSLGLRGSEEARTCDVALQGAGLADAVACTYQPLLAAPSVSEHTMCCTLPVQAARFTPQLSRSNIMPYIYAVYHTTLLHAA